MFHPSRYQADEGLVLWTAGPVRCTCLHVGPGEILIRLFSQGRMIDARMFQSADAASDYATHLMRAYDGR
jgi:hypothetical protein